nr:hypothetical protein [Candidatus Njordarchaeota archaeon]
MTRCAIARATGISSDILDETACLDMGEWMFVSYRATELRNIPVFIKAQSKEKILPAHLASGHKQEYSTGRRPTR